MNASVVKRTQEALGKVIKKPPLTEKLLSKPPFRYLHDIITEVIRMTGFMKGLYTDSELKSDNVKDKDAKISFLQKTIDVVIMVSGEQLSVKPARIVAGHEPEKTNELLQAIGKCCLNKLSSDDAVKRVLAGEKGDTKGKSPLTSKAQELDNKEFKEEELRIHKEKEERRNSEIKDRSTSRERKQREESKDEESKQREKDRDKEREKSKDNDRERHKDLDRDKVRDGERDRNKNRTKQEREREKSRDKDRGNKDRELERDKDKDRKNDGVKEKERLKERERERERDRDKGKEKDREKRRERLKDGEHSREHEKEKMKEQEKPEKKATSTVESLSKKFSESSVKDTRVEMDKELDLANRVSRSLTAKGSRWRSKNPVEGRREDNIVSAKTISDPIMIGLIKEPEQQMASPEIGRREANSNSASISDGSPASVWHENAEPEPTAKLKGDSTGDAEGEVGMVTQEKPVISENAEMPNELTAGIPQRRMPRPGSARPAPPRIKLQESVEVLVPERTGSGKMVSNVIIDSQNSDDEEDSQFVVEAAPQLSEMPEMDTTPAVELEEDEKHGGLVKKILETKKDYEKLQQSPKSTEKDRPLLLEAAWKKEKDIVSKEIEKLRTSIQTLCRSALPLGKIMDYIQEDMDAMQNELQLWHAENRQHAEALQKEQSITDCAVEPLKAELVELEQLIKDQQDKICAVKANILKNEEKIQKMVYSINISSRR
ncbi:TRAF3-interacting protein 1 isoform X3 [Trichosurus vulpecula]|uniref:TRAF3-interacting protein 1 isoform X3 n=1 Tax=Trichosurus vulpecula TaxID=9337 RepID=UPI00186B199C|nr:TRAF3-interacting protein 1 isoform X3 [Trichosurus vulpecula]